MRVRTGETYLLLRPGEGMIQPRGSLVVVSTVIPPAGDNQWVGYRYLTNGARGVMPAEEFTHRFQWQQRRGDR